MDIDRIINNRKNQFSGAALMPYSLANNPDHADFVLYLKRCGESLKIIFTKRDIYAKIGRRM
jgi:hypothetical protein